MTDETTTATLHDLPLDQLHPHPDNPRLALREEVVSGIAAQIAARGGFSPEYALLVRPIAFGYQIIAGHHRAEAAKRAGLTTVPCWVRVMDDDAAYMELGMGNTQGELSPLEVGLHAYGAIDLGKGGRGIAGGLSAYARRIGKSKQYLSQLVAAAQVYQVVKVSARVDTLPAKHLTEIARAPQAHWPDLVERVVSEDWTVEMTRAAVAELTAERLSDDDLRDLKRAVRKRGGSYDGTRTINDVVTRHVVTLPGQPQRSYVTAQLREVLPAYAEQDETLPADLAAAWELVEDGDARLLARHRATGITTAPGALPLLLDRVRQLQPDLDRLHAAGWIFRWDAEALLWDAHHPDVGTAQALEVPLLIRQIDRMVDLQKVAHVAPIDDEPEEATRLLTQAREQGWVHTPYHNRRLGKQGWRFRRERDGRECAWYGVEELRHFVQQQEQEAADQAHIPADLRDLGWVLFRLDADQIYLFRLTTDQRTSAYPWSQLDAACAEAYRLLSPAPAPAPVIDVAAASNPAPTAPAVDTVAAPEPAPPAEPDTSRDEWYTPEPLLALARQVLRVIDLDPASSLIAQRVVRAQRWHGTHDNGLQHEWHGTIWLNPPYSAPLITQFIDKALSEWQAGHITQMLILVNDQSDAAWYQQLLQHATAVCFLAQRVRFWHPTRTGEGPRQGQTVFYLGTDLHLFTRVFASHGTLMMNADPQRTTLTPGEMTNLWRCLHGDTHWLRHAKATLQRLAQAQELTLPVFADQEQEQAA